MKLASLILFLVGCGGTPQDSTTPSAPSTADTATTDPASAESTPVDARLQKAVDAARLATDILDNPAGTDTILAKAGTDRGAFDALLYELAMDPDLAHAYEEARAAIMTQRKGK